MVKKVYHKTFSVRLSLCQSLESKHFSWYSPLITTLLNRFILNMPQNKKKWPAVVTELISGHQKRLGAIKSWKLPWQKLKNWLHRLLEIWVYGTSIWPGRCCTDFAHTRKLLATKAFRLSTGYKKLNQTRLNTMGCCRSTSARLVESHSLNRRTYQARRQQTKNSRLKTSDTYITLFPIFVYKWYVVVTYPLHAHICNSCKRYVVVTYRSILFTPCKST